MTSEPVRTLTDLDTLNDQDIIAGYLEYDADAPWPGENRGRAYWHGWRNRAMDFGHIPQDEAAGQLVRAYLARERARRVA